MYKWLSVPYQRTKDSMALVIVQSIKDLNSKFMNLRFGLFRQFVCLTPPKVNQPKGHLIVWVEQRSSTSVRCWRTYRMGFRHVPLTATGLCDLDKTYGTFCTSLAKEDKSKGTKHTEIKLHEIGQDFCSKPIQGPKIFLSRFKRFGTLNLRSVAKAPISGCQ